ncbi:hypothetical protein ED312_09075 [Sinomicrobium pectinilyticum]|uniref:Uncharacterized protein n=1 Tax=Sinomicrobium pectinilyticum TaxID=1084421 RepID=A0A3N0EJH8_SINP1|nr:hypothetical protein ED312_09075 [Sinomicrobium pectinilyticum]
MEIPQHFFHCLWSILNKYVYFRPGKQHTVFSCSSYVLYNAVWKGNLPVLFPVLNDLFNEKQ